MHDRVQRWVSSSCYIAPRLVTNHRLLQSAMATTLPAIPAKRYFTIGEVADLCDVKPHVLRYWEQEFAQLKPMKRRGNRRYYQHHEVLMVRRIRELLYEQGFTISGARNRLRETTSTYGRVAAEQASLSNPSDAFTGEALAQSHLLTEMLLNMPSAQTASMSIEEVKTELLQIQTLLSL